MMNHCTLKFAFSSAHFYHQPKWSKEKNLAEFGKCFTEHGHGHNYTLECDLPFEMNDPKTAEFKAQAALIVGELDHQHLNFVIPEFKVADQRPALIPTTENIARYLFDRLNAAIPNLDFKIRLFEMENLWVEIQK